MRRIGSYGEQQHEPNSASKMRKTRRHEHVSSSSIVVASSYGNGNGNGGRVGAGAGLGNGAEGSSATANYSRNRNGNGNDDEDEDDDEAAEEQAPETVETRSCENCRRCKLKCSRTKPNCNKCVAKTIPCVYEQAEKKRGPRPGYIEELYRRIDALEHMVLGQAMMLRRDGPSSPVHATLQQAVDHERERLGNVGVRFHNQQQNQQLDDQQPSLPAQPSASQQPTPGSSAASQSRRLHALAGDHHDGFDDALSPDVLHQLCDAYRHQINPWMPSVRQHDLVSRIPAPGYPATALDPLLQAVAAASSQFVSSASRADNERRFNGLVRAGMNCILKSANLDALRISLLAQFLLIGKGGISSHWGLVIYPSHVAIQAGLHLEDHHLGAEHREFRLMIQLEDANQQTWVGKETVRRLFWVIFLQDHFTAYLAGTRPSFDSTTIRRLLPCDGQQWQEDQPVQTREFVPASVAIQVPVLADSNSNVGGFAYLVEATEIRANISAFVRRSASSTAVGMLPRQDIRGCLQEFLNLDLMLTNWKSKLPLRYQQASYDENGYMDHNITLAHLTHNMTTILLYQWPYTSWGTAMAGSDMPTTVFSQVLVVKQAAKEMAKICSRFLLHRRYLVSPQFAFCQFIAARALLVYSHWMMEPLDEDFERLYTSLGESAKRWDGSDMVQVVEGVDCEANQSILPNNLASRLQTRLGVDIKHPDAINLATPGLHLLKNMEWDGSGFKPSPAASHGLDSLGDLSDGSKTLSLMKPVASGDGEHQIGLTNSSGTYPGCFMGSSDDFEQAMAMLASNQAGELDTRIFSWHDSPENHSG